MCNRGRQSRLSHPTGVSESIISPRPRGPITGETRVIDSDGNIRERTSTSAQNINHLLNQLHPINRLKKEAQDRILAYLNISSTQFSEAQELISMTHSALSGSPRAAFQLAVRMVMSVFEVMQAQQTIRDRICSAYTFGYWVNKDRYPNLSSPKRPPDDLYQAHIDEDNHGNHDHISADQVARRWNLCNVNTLNQLNSSLNQQNMRTDLMRRFERMDITGCTPIEILRLYRRMILSVEFSNSPRLAASTFFLGTIQNLSAPEQRAATILYRRYPYDP